MVDAVAVTVVTVQTCIHCSLFITYWYVTDVQSIFNNLSVPHLAWVYRETLVEISNAWASHLNLPFRQVNYSFSVLSSSLLSNFSVMFWLHPLQQPKAISGRQYAKHTSRRSSNDNGNLAGTRQLSMLDAINVGHSWYKTCKRIHCAWSKKKNSHVRIRWATLS